MKQSNFHQLSQIKQSFLKFAQMEIQANIRHATIEDLPAIVDVYNQAIRSKFATGDTEEYDVESRTEWFQKFDPDDYPIYVAEVDDHVIGYSTLSPYRSGRKAMKKIAEISFYIDYSHHGKGIGSALINQALEDCSRIGKETLLAILLDVNLSSVKLLEKFRFSRWGHFPGVVDFGDFQCGQLIYGLNLKDGT